MTFRVRGTSKTEKAIMIFKFNDLGSVDTYSQEYKKKTITKEQFGELRSKPITASHLLVREDEDLSLSLRKQFKLFQKRAKLLKKLTNGQINLFKTGSESNTALQLFYDLCKPPEPDKITEAEAVFLSNCRGQLKHAINYKGKAWKLDIVSEYPSIMRSEHMQFPIKQGTLKTLTLQDFDEIKYFKYGIYRVKILTRINPFIFNINDKNYYTHIDLNFAKTLNYEMELVEDGNPNFLSYEGCLISGAKLFKPFVDYLFQFKKLGYKSIKIFLNKLWGKLCQKNVIVAKDNEIHENKNMLEICPIGDNLDHTSLFKIEVCSYESYYETDFARMRSFMLAKGRFMTAQYIMKNINDVVYVNTDGYLLKTAPNKEIKFGSEIGNLKLEAENHEVEVKNCNTVKGFAKVEIDSFNLIEADEELFNKLNP
jgi:hypothetical protein